MEREILNLEYNLKKLLVKALNAADSLVHAAQLTGVSVRTLRNYQRMYNIEYDVRRNEYFIKH